ncbi:MAG: DUF4249 domain-containing protein [Cyclobacteriaceae bacterium]|nr:DUF4249 domain-containing protein [Cyclobacteriaceae bacterium]
MRKLIVILIAFIFYSCEETVVLDLKQTPSKVVIEGLVTDKPGYQSVKVTRTADFYSSGKTPRITNASVVVSDDLGNEIAFVHNPNNHPDSTGIYLPETAFTGVVGRTYALRVEVDGVEYLAQDKLLPVTNIDSLKVQKNPDQVEDPKDEGKIYEVLLFAREPQNQKDFYLFKFYRNDTLTYFIDTDVYYSDDELLGEKIDGVPSPVYYGLNDVATVEMYSMSRQGYVYYNDLNLLLNNDGGMFGSIPASPRTNLSNGALGFFQVSAIATSSVVILE